jgi:hypothetical protein
MACMLISTTCRFKIILGLGDALLYLHQEMSARIAGCEQLVLHGHIKPSNVDAWPVLECEAGRLWAGRPPGLRSIAGAATYHRRYNRPNVAQPRPTTCTASESSSSRSPLVCGPGQVSWSVLGGWCMTPLSDDAPRSSTRRTHGSMGSSWRERWSARWRWASGARATTLAAGGRP